MAPWEPATLSAAPPGVPPHLGEVGELGHALSDVPRGGQDAGVDDHDVGELSSKAQLHGDTAVEAEVATLWEDCRDSEQRGDTTWSLPALGVTLEVTPEAAPAQSLGAGGPLETPRATRPVPRGCPLRAPTRWGCSTGTHREPWPTAGSWQRSQPVPRSGWGRSAPASPTGYCAAPAPGGPASAPACPCLQGRAQRGLRGGFWPLQAPLRSTHPRPPCPAAL